MKSQSRLHPYIRSLYTTLPIAVSLTFLGGLTSSALAQSISIDGSTSTQLNGTNSCSGNCDITGGLRDGNGSGSNLFHSFGKFDIDTGAVVTFEDPGVDNIFGRVTGSALSNIDGTLKVDGAANLFLLNPNGIVFGNNARLDIQGSFLASTADSIVFDDDNQFSATSLIAPSLLTISVPTGLQFGSSPGTIEVDGNGHSLAYNPNSFTISRSTPSSGLTVPTGQTLAFLGGNIDIQGGNFTAESGNIEVGSLGGNASVNFTQKVPGWNFDYTGASTFSDITLSDSASIDVSGSDAGSIQLKGKNIDLSEGSVILAKVLTNGGGEITLDASESISVTGIDFAPPLQQTPTGAYIEIAPGATGDGSSLLRIDTPLLKLMSGGQIGLGIAGAGTAGLVDVNAQTITVSEGSNISPSSLFSGVLQAFGPPFGPPPGAIGQGGDLKITTDMLSVTNGGQLIASTFGAGDAGNLAIKAQDIEVRGFNSRGPSSIVSGSELPIIPPLPGGSGNGGNLDIETSRLVVADGGQVSVGTNGVNPAGDISIVASDFVNLSGATELGRSGLFASSRSGRFGTSTGAGGSIQVETDRLLLSDGATINASNFPSTETPSRIPSEGPSGNIDIKATEISLKDGSLITTNTVSGNRANITLQSQSLVLRRGSNITTNATGVATGGNINIDTEALIAFEDSDITANATDNFGGRIIVNAATILGTAYREQLTSESDITASSALGPAFSGSVEINNPETDPTDGLTKLPDSLASENQVVAACEQIDSNTFVATGRGGLPENATQLMTGQSVWNDFRSIEAVNSISNLKSDLAPDIGNTARETVDIASVQTPTVVEAQTWFTEDDGQVVLGRQKAASVDTHLLAICLAQQ